MPRPRTLRTFLAPALRRRSVAIMAVCGALLLIQSPSTVEPAPSGRTVVERPSFAIADANLSPGAVSRVSVIAPEGSTVRGGRFVLKFSPPIFLDTPTVAFQGAPPDLAFGLSPIGAGRYAVEFAVPPYAADLGPGRLFTISGVLLPSLPVGGNVNVTLAGDATAGDGSEIAIQAREPRLRLISDPYPKLTIHVLDRYDLIPGSAITVELQTYNPKLLSDGQICLRFDSTVFTSVESIGVQGDSDVSYVAGPDDNGLLIVRFSSPTSSINRLEAALVRLGMRVAADLPPGFETIVEVDVDQSFLRDHNGEAVPLEGDSGRFTVATSGH